jgi:LemA protein
MGTAVIIGVVVLLLIVALVYNGLVSRRNRCESAFSTIDVMLKKRYDLIPNLVETVKGYAAHERATFEELARLRSQVAAGRLSTEQTVSVNNRITSLLGNLLAVVENYPQLKASANFLHLQRSLNEIEEQIAAARRAFNAAVMDLNNSVQMFPSSLIASLAGIGPRSFLDAPPQERAAPQVGPLTAPGPQEGP